MNSTSLDLGIFPVTRDVISDEDFVTIDYAFGYVMLIISLVGVATNSINIRTFVWMGLGDGMTVTLLGLSTSDLGFTFFGTIFSSASIIAAIEVKQEWNFLPIHPRSVMRVITANIGIMFYITTCMITTFMAIARCMCVAMPFQFKDYFTKTRSALAVVISYFISLALLVALLSQFGVQRIFDPVVNKTRFVLWVSPIRSVVKNVAVFIQSFAINFLSSLAVGTCIAIMAKVLKRSQNFRQTMSIHGVDKLGHKLSGKELQVVQQVFLIGIIYTTGTIPLMFFAVYRSIEDEFDIGRRLHNFYCTFTNILLTVQLTNSATTFLVYYFYNSKFRSHCTLTLSRPNWI